MPFLNPGSAKIARWRKGLLGRAVSLLSALLLLAAGGCPGSESGRVDNPPPGTSPETYRAKVVAEYPHDTDAFTQGLAFRGDELYEGTGRYGRSELRLVDLKTGEVLRSHSLTEEYFGEGVTVLGENIYQLTWRSNVGFVYDLDFELLKSFEYPTEGWGLTHDGDSLIMSDGTATLSFLDPDTLKTTQRLEVTDNGEPVSKLNELEHVEGRIFANIFLTDRIAIISPKDGVVSGWIELEGLLDDDQVDGADVLNGIAYSEEEDRLFVTGKLWPTLFEIELISSD